MHVHAFSYEGGRKFLPRLLAYGITGVRDMASAVDDAVRLKQEAAEGAVLAPQMIVAGPILQGPLPFQLPPFVRTVTDEEAKPTIAALVAKGVDFIKDTTSRRRVSRLDGVSGRLHDPPRRELRRTESGDPVCASRRQQDVAGTNVRRSARRVEQCTEETKRV